MTRLNRSARLARRPIKLSERWWAEIWIPYLAKWKALPGSDASPERADQMAKNSSRANVPARTVKNGYVITTYYEQRIIPNVDVEQYMRTSHVRASFPTVKASLERVQYTFADRTLARGFMTLVTTSPSIWAYARVESNVPLVISVDFNSNSRTVIDRQAKRFGGKLV